MAAQADAADSQQHRQLQEAVQQPTAAAATASAARGGGGGGGGGGGAAAEAAAAAPPRRQCWGCGGPQDGARRVACPRCHKELYCSEACQHSHAEAHGPFCATVAPEGLMLRAKMQAEALGIAQRESAEAAQCAEILAQSRAAAAAEEAAFDARMAQAMRLGGGGSSSSHRR